MNFFDDKVSQSGYTFDDVLIIPGYSKVLPRDVSLTTHLTQHIKLNIPIISAAMDTVTESSLAIAIAREGGIGVIHKNMPIEEQIRQIKTVKRAENGMIYDPITIQPNKTVKDALDLMNEYNIGGIPVVDNKKILLGIVTNRDLRFEDRVEKPINEVMTKDNLITTSEETDLEQASKILQAHKIEKLPVVNDSNKLLGLVTYKDIEKAKNKPNAAKDPKGRLRVAAALGIFSNTLEIVEKLIQAEVDAIIVDTAHGHSAGVINTIRKIKNTYPELQVIAGNIATSEAAQKLIEAGADALKVGVGPGSICTTRVIAGVGIPQLSAIYNVVCIAKKKNIPVIADGGLRYSGDIVKALAAGAHTVMAGSLLAGVEESPGKTIIYQGRKFKSYRGMGSIEAMQQGSKDRYFQDAEDDIKKLVPEGITAKVPFKGSLEEVIYQLNGGLRAGMGYCGAQNISELQNAKFTQITNAGVIESHPHDISITSEAPNYSREKL